MVTTLLDSRQKRELAAEVRALLDDQRLDEALEMTFPASDPVAVSRRDRVESRPSVEDLPPKR
jgi:hypothetical protein